MIASVRSIMERDGVSYRTAYNRWQRQQAPQCSRCGTELREPSESGLCGLCLLDDEDAA